jgi:hypothetical protein
MKVGKHRILLRRQHLATRPNGFLRAKVLLLEAQSLDGGDRLARPRWAAIATAVATTNSSTKLSVPIVVRTAHHIVVTLRRFFAENDVRSGKAGADRPRSRVVRAGLEATREKCDKSPRGAENFPVLKNASPSFDVERQPPPGAPADQPLLSETTDSCSLWKRAAGGSKAAVVRYLLSVVV